MGIFSKPLEEKAQSLLSGRFSQPIQTAKLNVGGRFSQSLTQATSREELIQQPDIAKSIEGFKQTEEDPKKIYSGGVISDIFDTLNVLQYGVVGMLKGKGFSEGVKTRQSWSDKDALGDFGIPGAIAGTILDIGVDPFTYIAPLTIAKKIPGFTKGVDAATTAFKATSIGKSAAKLGKELGEKLIYSMSGNPTVRKMTERMFNTKGLSDKNIIKTVNNFIEISEDSMKKLLDFDEFGAVIRRPLEEIAKEIDPKDFEVVKRAFNQLDEYSETLAKLNPAMAGDIAKNKGSYIMNAYEEFELSKKSGVFSFLKGKPVRKARKLLTVAEREALGQITNPGYLLGKSMLEMNKDIEYIKLYNGIAKKFASGVELPGYKQLSKSERLLTTATSEKKVLYGEVKKIHEKLFPMLKELKKTEKLDKSVVKLIDNTMDALSKTKGMQVDELSKFINPLRPASLDVVNVSRKIGTLPDTLLGIAEDVKKFTKFDDFMKSDIGLKVEKLYESGVLERNNFSSVESFFNYVKKPFKKATTKLSKEVLVGDAGKLVKLQRSIEALSEKALKLKTIDKASIDDSLNLLNKAVATLKGEEVDVLRKAGNLDMSELAGQYVPESVHKMLEELERPLTGVEKSLGKVMGSWKFGKVILNPAGHIRNLFSNLILNSWEGLSPLRVDIYKDAAVDLAKYEKGLPTKWIKEIEGKGFDLNTFANEIRHLIEANPGEGITSKAGKTIKGVADKLTKAYGMEENWGKTAQYIFQRKSGKSIDEAWEIAERATFNYSQVTPFVRKLRSSMFGFPFVTFGMKAGEQFAKTALKHPGRISYVGKIKNAIENQADLKELTRERASEPPWVRDGFYIKLPIKDEAGRSAYFDMTYILPFGDLVTGQFLSRSTDKDTGLQEGVPSALVKKSPFINLIRELATNKDFSGNNIWKDSDDSAKQLVDMMRHITKFSLPPIASEAIPGGIGAYGERKPSNIQSLLDQENLSETQKRTLMQELLRQFGVKISPVNVETQEGTRDYYNNKAIDTFLKESGLAKEYTNTYIPKQ